MKKVLILTTISGFLTQFEMNDVSILKELGLEICYASNFRNPVYHTDKQALEQKGIRLFQIEIEKSPLHILRNCRALLQIGRLIRTEQIELVHCHNPMGGVLGRLAAIFYHKQNIKIIYTAHGFHFYKGAPLKNWLCYYPVEALLARMTDCLITINTEDEGRAKAFSLRKNGFTVQIPGVGVKTEQFRKAVGRREQIRKELGIKEEEFFILSVGELNQNKNHEVILRAVAALKDPRIKYGICGKGRREKQLRKLAKKLGIEKQVTLFGFRNDIPRVLQSADCFAFPSKREGLGIAAIEAMAGGIPLITSDCRGTREYMEDGVTGYVCKTNQAKAYARAIKQMKEEQTLRFEMGKNCRERAKRFDLSRTDRIMRKVYGKLAGTEAPCGEPVRTAGASRCRIHRKEDRVRKNEWRETTENQCDHEYL